MNYIMLVALMASAFAYGCPTCVGRIEHDSPAFFRDDFYTPDTQLKNKQDLAQKQDDSQEVPSEEEA